MDFDSIAHALHAISATSQTSVKETLLRKYVKLPGFKDVLKFIYDPNFTTGIKAAKLDAAIGYGEGITPENIMQYLKQHSTGDAAACDYAFDFVYQYDDPVVRWAAEGLVTKHLRTGISVTTLNKVFGAGFIPVIGIMRGKPCPDDAYGHYIVTEKIDGNRRLIFKDNDGNVKMFTRSGKPDDGLVDIVAEVAEKLPAGFVYDCECVAEGKFADSIALRQASASLLNTKGKQRRGVKALCFDVIPIEEYNMGISKQTALMRKLIAAVMFRDTVSVEALKRIAKQMATVHAYERFVAECDACTSVYAPAENVTFEHINVLPILGCAHNKQEGIAFAQPIWDANGEGCMLVEWSSPYVVSPNPQPTLLKIKLFKEYVATCTALNEGTGKYAGMLGAITCSVMVNGKEIVFDAGSGFTDAQRVMFWDNPESLVGKRVEIDSFGVSMNAQGLMSLNCPVFKRVVGDVE